MKYTKRLYIVRSNTAINALKLKEDEEKKGQLLALHAQFYVKYKIQIMVPRTWCMNLPWDRERVKHKTHDNPQKLVTIRNPKSMSLNN